MNFRKVETQFHGEGQRKRLQFSDYWSLAPFYTFGQQNFSYPPLPKWTRVSHSSLSYTILAKEVSETSASKAKLGRPISSIACRQKLKGTEIYGYRKHES